MAVTIATASEAKSAEIMRKAGAVLRPFCFGRRAARGYSPPSLRCHQPLRAGALDAEASSVDTSHLLLPDDDAFQARLAGAGAPARGRGGARLRASPQLRALPWRGARCFFGHGALPWQGALRCRRRVQSANSASAAGCQRGRFCLAARRCSPSARVVCRLLVADGGGSLPPFCACASPPARRCARDRDGRRGDRDGGCVRRARACARHLRLLRHALRAASCSCLRMGRGRGASSTPPAHGRPGASSSPPTSSTLPPRACHRRSGRCPLRARVRDRRDGGDGDGAAAFLAFATLSIAFAAITPFARRGLARLACLNRLARFELAVLVLALEARIPC